MDFVAILSSPFCWARSHPHSSTHRAYSYSDVLRAISSSGPVHAALGHNDSYSLLATRNCVEVGRPNRSVIKSRTVKKVTTGRFLKEMNSARDLMEPWLLLMLLRPERMTCWSYQASFSSAKPSSKRTFGVQPVRRLIREISANVTSASPFRRGA